MRNIAETTLQNMQDYLDGKVLVRDGVTLFFPDKNGYFM